MKRLVLILIGSLAACGLAMAAVQNTAHDLSSNTTTGDTTSDTTQICVFCHTPHQDTGTKTILWNQTDSAAGSYGAYSSDTFDLGPSTALASTDTNNTSVLCMTCHDGTVAIGSLHNEPFDAVGGTLDLTYGGNVNASGLMTGNPNMGSDLSNDHPVNFSYTDPTGVDDDLNDPTGISLPLFGTGGDEIQCGTCHNAHGGLASTPFLRLTMAASALCTECHNK